MNSFLTGYNKWTIQLVKKLDLQFSKDDDHDDDNDDDDDDDDGDDDDKLFQQNC